MGNIMIPAGATEIINQLNAIGHEAYLVGGCVRDYLMRRTPNDWDICTSATPNEVLQCFKDDNVIETGLKHGTVTVMKSDGGYEVTTFRVDGEYKDGRHPEEVRFVTQLVDDLARRDFTINAIAMDGHGVLYDPFGGELDIRNQVIRCVGDAAERFKEDGLRVLRALRFSSVLDFTIHPDTREAIHSCKHMLTNISAERITSELCKLLTGFRVGDVLREYSDVIGVFIPEILPCVGFNQNNPYHIYDVWNHIVDTVEHAPFCVRLALLFHDIGKPSCYSEDERGGHFYGHPMVSAKMADEIMRRLKFDNETRESTVELVLYHDAELVAKPGSVKRWLNRIGEEQFLRLLDIKKADMESHTPGTQIARLWTLASVSRVTEQIVLEDQCFTMKDLALNGNDVMQMKDLEPGPEVGRILKEMLSLVIDEKLPNTREALTEWLIEIQ